MSIETKQKVRHFYDKHIWLIWLVLGVIVGIFIDGKIHYKITLIGEQIGSVAEWVSGLGTIMSVMTALHLATRQKTDVKVHHSIKQQFDRVSKEYIPNTLSITFFAYNQSNNAVYLQFYGLRKSKSDDFVRSTSYEKKEIKSGGTLDYEFLVSDLNREYHLQNYTGKIEVGFAKPDGTLYTETFKWNNFELDTEGLKNMHI